MCEICSSFGLLQRAWVTSPAPPSATHTACLLGYAVSIPLLLLFLVGMPWYWHLQNSGVFCYNWATITIASPGFSLWWKASTFLPDLFSSGASTASHCSICSSSIFTGSLTFHLYFIYLLISLCVLGPICVGVCAYEHRPLQRPEEGARSPDLLQGFLSCPM